MKRPLRKAIMPGYGDNCFKVERVKEAVEGLKEDLEHYCNTRQIRERNTILNFVDNWFEDVS